IAVDQLALQRDGGGGDHHGAAGAHRVPQARHQIGQRLAGAGARLHGQMPLGVDGAVDGRGHPDLPLPFPAAERAPGGGQQFRGGRQFGHASSLLPGTDSGLLATVRPSTVRSTGGYCPPGTDPVSSTPAARNSARARRTVSGATPAVRSNSTLVSNPAARASRAVARTQWSVAMPTTSTAWMSRARSQSVSELPSAAAPSKPE